VFIACWSTKGGVGTTVVAAALAILLARRSPAGALIVDLAGDVPAALGSPSSRSGGRDGGAGVADWLAAAPDVPPDGLVRLEARAGPGLAVVPRGDGPLRPGIGADSLAALLVDERRPVVVDCGRLDSSSADVALSLAAGATRSLLVVRSCFLGLHRARDALIRPSGVVLVAEPGRSIAPNDVEAVLDVPVLCRVRVTDTIARAVDAGLLAAHLPRTLAKDLRHAAA
jgi:hypothetical protein